MKSGFSLTLFVGLAFLCGGCHPGPETTGSHAAFPAQIGVSSPADLPDADPYERAVVQIISHLEDGARVLAAVEDVDSARHAAGMFIEAADRVVRLRSEMLRQRPDDAIPPAIAVAYGPRYLLARLETERQLDRISQLAPEVHEPLGAVLERLDGRVKQAEQAYKEGGSAEQQGG